MRIRNHLFIYLLILNQVLNANIVIENASIWDGESQKQYLGNILIKDERIENISNRKFQAEKTIDASGMIMMIFII
jgi:dihydroorotase-like cyclic amidohydrolase